ncbi:MAG: DJ-1/PfpI family protein, partial [Halothece sp.]
MTVPDSCFSPPRVAILIEQNFENFTFKVPYTAFQQMGAKVLVFCDRLPKKYQRKQKKVSFQPTNQLTEAKPEDFDVVILPSGIEGKGLHSRINTIHFVDRALKFGKIVAAISQGVQVLIEGDLVKYRNVAGFSTIEKDIIKAGGNYLDEPLVIDGNLFTSRQPSDLPIFMTAILSRLKLPLPDQASPNSPSRYPEWWQLAEVWGGSSKDEIINKLNTALVGEFYTQKTFEQYLEKACNSEVRSLFKEIISTKKQHIEKLQYRLHQLGQNCSLPTGIADNLAQFDTAFIG